MKPKLITTIGEIQQNVPVNMTTDIDVVSPFLNSAEISYVIRFIGKEQFDELVAAYEPPIDDETDDDKLIAIRMAQKVIANLGYMLGLPVLSLSIGTSGIQISTNENAKQAFQWQVADLKDSLADLGFTGLEELLTFLGSKPDVFDKYADSDECKKQKQLLINTAVDFDSYYHIKSSCIIFQTIAYIIKRVEDQTLAKLVGPVFLQSLKVEELSDKKKILVDSYLKPGLALATIAKALVERVVSLENGQIGYNFKGRTENMKESQSATNQQISATCDQLVADANLFFQDGLEYIKTNASDFEGFQPPAPRRRFKINNDPSKGVFAV